MSLNNEIRRVKRYLEVFEVEGSGKVMNDLLDLTQQFNLDDNDKTIRYLRQLYKKELEDLLAKQNSYKQTQINF